MQPFDGAPPPPDGGAEQHHSPAGVKAWAQHDLAPPEHRLQYLPNYGGIDGKAKVMWPSVDKAQYEAMLAPHGSIAARTHNAPVAKVRLDQLQAIQHSVNVERLGQHLADPHIYKEGQKGSGHGGLVDLPVVVQKNGQLYIHDGHHRLMAQHLRGLPTAKVRLVNLDAEVDLLR
jgi:ParB-like nuclease domain